MSELVIGDDHASVRAGIRLVLSGERDLKVVGEAENGLEALELCRKLRPDLVLMDVRMPEMDGLGATRAIKRRFPGTSVLILTIHEDQDYLLEAIKVGAAGYVLKDAPRQALLTAVRKVLEGETTLNRDLATQLLKRLVDDNAQRRTLAPPEPEHAKLSQPLTPRELEVLVLLPLGLTNREIAQRFVISTGTVKNHVEHIMVKLSVSDRTQAVVRALEMGIIGFPRQC